MAPLTFTQTEADSAAADAALVEKLERTCAELGISRSDLPSLLEAFKKLEIKPQVLRQELKSLWDNETTAWLVQDENNQTGRIWLLVNALTFALVRHEVA